METADRVQITNRELEKYIRQWRLSHPQEDQAREILEKAIHEAWPGVAVADLTEQVFINWIGEQIHSDIHRIASDPDQWISTRCQGDLFADWNVHVPPWLVIDGIKTPYYKLSPLAHLEFLQARETALSDEIRIMDAALENKRRSYRIVEAELAKVNELVREIRDKGIDPATVHYEK